jgi:hypothetical protein
MVPAIFCYRGGPKRWATLGETRELRPAGGGVHVVDGNVEVDLWALFPWLWHSKIHVTTSVLLLMQCSIVYVLFIYAITNVFKGVHSCRTLFITVASSFGPFFGPSSDLNSKTHETNYINCLYTLEKKTSSSIGLTTARNYLLCNKLLCTVHEWTPLDTITGLSTRLVTVYLKKARLKNFQRTIG